MELTEPRAKLRAMRLIALLRPLGGACLLVLLQSSDIFKLAMADEASGTDDQWEGESGDDGNFHGSFGRPYRYNYEYGEYSERPYGFVSPPFPPPYPVCESSSAMYTPPTSFLELKPSLTRVPMKSR